MTPLPALQAPLAKTLQNGKTPLETRRSPEIHFPFRPLFRFLPPFRFPSLSTETLFQTTGKLI